MNEYIIVFIIFYNFRTDLKNAEYAEPKYINQDHITVKDVHIKKEYARCVVKKYLTQKIIVNRLLEGIFINYGLVN